MDSPQRSPPPIPDAENPIPQATLGSAVNSPPHDTENQTARLHQKTNPQIGNVAVMVSPVRSPPLEEITAKAVIHQRASSVQEEAVSGSPVRLPPRSAEKDVTATPTPSENKPLVYRANSAVDEAVTRSVVGSPSHPAEDQTAAPLKESTTASSVQDEEAVLGSPVRLPPNSAEKEIIATPKETMGLVVIAPASSVREEAVIGSPGIRSPEVNDTETESMHQKWIPPRDVENPSPNPNALPQHKESSLGSPVRGALTMGSILHLPPENMAKEDPFLNEKAKSPTVAVANKMVTNEMKSATTVGEKGGGGKGLMRMDSGTLKQPAMRKAAVGFRILALVLSLISFSVMAAIRTSGWAGDSFDRYIEFRYCLSANIIAFVYSLFQIYVQVHHKIKNKRIMSRRMSYYLDFSMDQLLAYLLMSASSSAASRNGDWVSNFGSDKFTDGMTGSIAVSFLVFLALAVSSVISAYKFFTWICF